MINDDNCKSVALTEDMGCTVHSKPNFPKLNNGKLAEKDKSAISNKQMEMETSKSRERMKKKQTKTVSFWIFFAQNWHILWINKNYVSFRGDLTCFFWCFTLF